MVRLSSTERTLLTLKKKVKKHVLKYANGIPVLLMIHLMDSHKFGSSMIEPMINNGFSKADAIKRAEQLFERCSLPKEMP